ncbi:MULTISPECIES: hypothetical protein [Nonlabens]|uniref:Lipoprotein n=1 Tax=Nonlabens xylanidelens TaxID=191564 RepID=A0A2S6ILH9_9FLAO|nr:hypothetical protein [Nonlabens xylanidelens]PPK95000.1 hypothetical protein LY01_01753 [Nonlabens xylanidelens]PQJ17542.1 hypothetical protein BST94_10835 [Nonlabens xylanidelens]
MKHFLTLLVASFLLTSCYTTQSLANRVESEPVVLTKTMLTGLYENKIPDDQENSLWNDLCLHFPKKSHDVLEGNQVYIEYREDKTITAELYQFGRLIDTMTLKGTPKDNYFTIRRGSSFFTILLITNKVSKKTILGNDANADLILAQGYSSNTMLLEDQIGDKDGTVTATYMRLGDTRPAKTSFQ